jgi:protein-arginine kinase activator protein McsA
MICKRCEKKKQSLVLVSFYEGEKMIKVCRPCSKAIQV